MRVYLDDVGPVLEQDLQLLPITLGKGAHGDVKDLETCE